MAKSSPRQLAVVTGASSGIGLELARQFAQHDFDLLVAADGEGIQAAATSLRGLGCEVEAVQVDLATRAGVDRLWERMQAQERPVEAVAINAGAGVGGPFIDTDLRAELRLIDLNVISVVYLSKLVLRDMVSRGQGRVLYTSSIAAEMPAPFEAVYAASKAFELSFAEAVRNELRDTGVTITVLQPGPTDTDFFSRAGLEDTEIGRAGKDDPAEVAREGFEALMSGRDHVVSGSLKNKLQSTLSPGSPRNP